jgi:hypothetical protein
MFAAPARSHGGVNSQGYRISTPRAAAATCARPRSRSRYRPRGNI